MKTELPKVNCKMVGQDGNAWAIMGRFQAAARKAKWPQEEIKKVLDEAMAGDYDHLLITIMEHCKNP
jgi:hypothetical protein